MSGMRISLFSITVLIFGFVLLALPEEGFSGILVPQIDCCQGVGVCGDSSEGPIGCPVEDLVPNAVCDEATGLCVSNDIPTPPEPSNIPTLGEWGLIAMAGILGIAGFLFMRRRKAAA